MKKINYLLLTLLVSIFMIPMVFAKDEVKIESYELVENSETTSELSKPKIDGLTISFDLSFSKVKDFAKYKIVVDNPTTKDYEISKDIDFDISDYIDYSYEFEKDNNIVKADSKMTMFIVVTYAKEVPASMMKDGKFIENNKMAISLSNDNASSTSKEENPNTASSILIVCVLGLTISLLSLILFAKTKKQKYITTFILSLFIMPATIFALEKLQVNVETKITIEEKYKVTHERYTAIKASEKDQCIQEVKAAKATKTAAPTPPKLMIGNEEYIECSITTEEYYAKDDIVNIKPLPYNYINRYEYNEETNKNEYICEYDEENNIENCPESVIKEDKYYGVGYYRYNNEFAERYDNEVMNITNVDYDDWANNGKIEFKTPSKFTMPAHDVYLVYYNKTALLQDTQDITRYSIEKENQSVFFFYFNFTAI